MMLELHLIVDVTAEDIAGGNKENCFTCPVALAVLRAAACIGVTGVHVQYSRATVRAMGQRFRAAIPFSVTDRIREFDGGGTILPFRFPLVLKEVV